MAENDLPAEEAGAAEDAAMASEMEPEEASEPTTQKRFKKNKWVVPGVIIAIVIVLGIGFTAWHNTPGFCNAICHDPMDPYVETVVNGHAGMASADHANAGVSCLGCHEAKLTEQVSEVMAWTSGDFTTDANGKIVPSANFASQEFCARSGCHDMSEVTEKTWGFEGNDAKYNPHSSHQDLALECGDCHKAHDESVLVCNDCHALNAPEGWEG